MINKKRFLKGGIFVLFIVMIAIISVPFLFKKQFKNYLTKQYNESQSEYFITIGDLEPFLLSGSVKVYNIELKNKNSGSLSALSVLSANSVTINNVSFFRLIFRKGFHAGKVEIESPNIVMNKVIKTNDSISEKNSDLKKMPDIFLSEVIISNPHFSYFSNISDTLPLIKTEHGNIYIGGFTFNDLKPGEQFAAEKLWGELENINYLTQDSLYTINISKINLSYSDSLFSIDSLNILPNYSKKEFGQKAGKQTDRITIHISKLKSTSFDAKYFTEIQAIKSGLITIDALSVEAYRDKNIERKVEYPAFIQQLIKDVKFPVEIEKIIINNGSVVYEERKEGKEKSGRIAFDNIKTEITNISNQSISDTLLIQSSCAFNGKGKFAVKLSFPMTKNNNSFFCEGLITKLPMNTLNTMVPYLAGISFKSGLIDTMKFDFLSRQDVATGNLQMNYRDFVVEAVDANDGHSKNAGKKVLSFIVNNFVVKRDVPSEKNKNNTSTLYYKRNPQRFIFNNTLKTIVSGAKKIVTGTND